VNSTGGDIALPFSVNFLDMALERRLSGTMPRQVLIAACILAVAATSNTNSFGLVFVPVAEGLGISVAALGGLRTLENAVSIVVAILVAPMIDRYPRKYVMMLGYGSATAASLTLILVNSPIGAVAFFMLNGASIMLILGSLTAMPSDFITGRPLNRVMGLIIGCIAFTSIIVAPIVGNVSERLSWEAGMLVSSGVTGTAFLITLLVVPSYQVESSGPPPSGFLQRYRVILGQIPLLLMLGNNLFRFAQLGSMMTFTSSILILRFDLALGRIGLVFAAIGVVFFTFSAGCGLYLHVLKTRRVLVWGGLAAATLMACTLVFTTPLYVTLPGIILIIGIIAAQINTGTIAVLRLSPWARGAAMAWNELAAATGSLIGIGLGSIGLAIAGVSGLGAVLCTLAIGGAVVSRVALFLSKYSDEDDAPGPTQVRPERAATAST
jgi:predicted MFS family arabinose efflux permease